MSNNDAVGQKSPDHDRRIDWNRVRDELGSTMSEQIAFDARAVAQSRESQITVGDACEGVGRWTGGERA